MVYYGLFCYLVLSYFILYFTLSYLILSYLSNLSNLIDAKQTIDQPEINPKQPLNQP